MNAASIDSAAASKRLRWIVLGVLGVYVVLFAWQIRACFVDDAYIGLQYVRNLLAGNGFVFQLGGPPVEGVTNVGWLLVLAPFAAVAGETVAAKLLGLLLLLTAFVLVLRLGQRLGAAAKPQQAVGGLAVVAVLLLAANFDFMYFSLAGMETALLAVVLLAMASIALRRPDSFWLGVLGAFAFLVHPEAIVVFPLYTLLALGGPKVERRKLLLGNLILIVLVGAVTAIRYAYFRDVLPNTFHSKPSNPFRVVAGGFALLMGQNVNVPFPITGWLALPVLVLGWLRLRRSAPSGTAMLAAVTATGLAFCVYSLPDWTEMGRYFAPYLPAALLLFWAGLAEAIRRLLGPTSLRGARELAAVVAIVLLALVGTFDGRKKMARMDNFPGYVLAGKNLVTPSLWIREHLPEHATIATRRIGALAYFSDKAIFDYTSGLPDREVARLVRASGHRFNLPTDPALAELWPARSPDYLLEDAELIDLIASQSGGSRSCFTVHGLTYGEMKRFPIGHNKHWVLAQRLDTVAPGAKTHDPSPSATPTSRP